MRTDDGGAALRLVPGVPGVPGPPARLGRLLNCYQVAELIGGVSADWVRRNVPGKIDLGHSTKRWYDSDVLDWIDSRREGL